MRGSERARVEANDVSETRGNANGEKRPVSEDSSENRGQCDQCVNRFSCYYSSCSPPSDDDNRI
ncbi:hypothetical protein C495_06343 [Natronorubrum sulfidifaciens JCM 14089]|uniref:Uncharacterized protein n=1 Tax=Natronorubrum sulfidifaciens JCM 14089 TaxID=1230460 RepID=L9WB28_9EURY|nr:hypothetical protein C495_06343 [Natronorubrum sulfidifaciens JCM 14089]